MQSSQQQVLLDDHFTMTILDTYELLQLIKRMKDAAPGPDSLNITFYRAAWDWIQEDVTDLITNFYRKRVNFQNL